MPWSTLATIESWEPILVSRLEELWKTSGTKNDYVDFLSKYGRLWFTESDGEEIESLLST